LRQRSGQKVLRRVGESEYRLFNRNGRDVRRIQLAGKPRVRQRIGSASGTREPSRVIQVRSPICRRERQGAKKVIVGLASPPELRERYTQIDVEQRVVRSQLQRTLECGDRAGVVPMS